MPVMPVKANIPIWSVMRCLGEVRVRVRVGVGVRGRGTGGVRVGARVVVGGRVKVGVHVGDALPVVLRALRLDSLPQQRAHLAWGKDTAIVSRWSHGTGVSTPPW